MQSSQGPVLVVGASGQVGSAVTALLLERGVPVRALTHRTETAEGLLPGAEVVVGDLTAPDSIDAALSGTSAVLLVWTAPPDTVDAVVERLADHDSRVVFLSAPFRTAHPFFQQPNPMATLYARIEDQLAAAGVATTIIRPGMFATNALNWWAPTIRAGGEVRWPYGDVETAPVDDRDVAAVVARVLTHAEHVGGDYVITGPESITQAAQVQIIGEVLGRPVTYVDLSPDEFRSTTAGTWPPAIVEMLLNAWGAAKGQPAYVTTAVSDVLGVAPRTFREWATDNIPAFTS